MSYSLSHEKHIEIAKILYEAKASIKPIKLLTETYPNLTIDDAYAIQQEGLKINLNNGLTVVGRKIGITSRGMMKLLNCDSPDFGYLLSNTEVTEDNPFIRSSMNVPIVEGELCFIFEEDLPNRHVNSEDIININPYVVPSFEICDARYPSWKVTILDTISDNAGAAMFKLGKDKKRLNEINPFNIGMVMEKNGSLVGSGAGVEVMGSPINSIVWLANKLFDYGTHIKAGDVVLSGAIIAADPANQGDNYKMSMDGFEPIYLEVK